MKLYKALSVSVAVLTVIASVLIVLVGLRSAPDSNADKYSLKAYKNTVALYKGEKLMEIYDGIVLDTLPEADRYALENGIDFDDLNEVRSAVEDYDG